MNAELPSSNPPSVQAVPSQDTPPLRCGLQQQRAVSNTRFGCILSVCDDPRLLKTRELVLRSGGHAVRSIASSAWSELDLLPFNLVVLCHTLSRNRDQLCAEMQARNGGAAILFLAGAATSASNLGVPVIKPFPVILLATVENLLLHRWQVSLGTQN